MDADELALIADRALWDGEDDCAPWRHVVRRDDALFWTSDGPWPWANGVGWVRWSETELELRVDEMLAFFRDRRRSVSWVVGPSSVPPTVADALRRRGLTEHAPRLLAAMLPLPFELRLNHAVEVREVATEADVATALRIEFPDWVPEQYARALCERSTVMRCPARRSGAMLAVIDGVPVGYSAWRVASDGRALQLIGGAVRPEFQDQRVYTTLLAARIAKARERDIDIVVMGGADPTTSGPILMRYGFQDLGVVPMFKG